MTNSIMTNDYMCIRATSVATLNVDVNAALLDGYIPYGNVASSQVYYNNNIREVMLQVMQYKKPFWQSLLFWK